MKQKRKILALLLGLVFWLQTSPVSHAAPRRQSIGSGRPGIEFKVARESTGYTVFMRPNSAPSGPGQTLTAQITVRVPHGTEGDRFTIGDLTSLVEGVAWLQRSRSDAPPEAPGFDYISFEFDYFLSNFGAIAWQAGQEVKLFTFTNSGSYQGDIALMENCDAFRTPNSQNTNPGNQIAVTGLDSNNAYLGNYDVTVATACTTDLYLPVVSRQ